MWKLALQFVLAFFPYLPVDFYGQLGDNILGVILSSREWRALLLLCSVTAAYASLRKAASGLQIGDILFLHTAVSWMALI
ncbi:hypothetical protein XELAEV_18034810mg [Xenopus laevis]|uniref:Pecanex-like protein n=1 Tax=Xenopus laevis TaxID=8355 RepID=A0A974CF61_XENLA|nr:hypothetical protein XELAEV_18034810mg [Xenopus laevis]